MAQTPEQNRRYQAALRRVLARLRAEQPDTYRAWLEEALEELTLAHAPEFVASRREADEDLRAGRTRPVADVVAEMDARWGGIAPKPHEKVGKVTVLPNGNRATVIGVEPNGDEVVRIDPPADSPNAVRLTAEPLGERTTAEVVAPNQIVRRKAGKAHEGERWNGFAWVPTEPGWHVSTE